MHHLILFYLKNDNNIQVHFDIDVFLFDVFFLFAILINLTPGLIETSSIPELFEGVNGYMGVTEQQKFSSSFTPLDIHALFKPPLPGRLCGEFSNVKGNGNTALTALDKTFNLLL